MRQFVRSILGLVALPFRTRWSMQLEILALRSQLAAYQLAAPGRLSSAMHPAHGSAVLGVAVAYLARMARRVGVRSAENSDPVAAETLPRALGKA